MGRDFPPVQTGPGAHPASCIMGTGSFPRVKYGRGVLLTTHPLLVSRSWKSRAILLSTLWATTGPVTGTLYLYLFLISMAMLLSLLCHSQWLHHSRVICCRNEHDVLVIQHSLGSSYFCLVGPNAPINILFWHLQYIIFRKRERLSCTITLTRR